MFVVKRDGRKESVKFDKVSKRVSRLCKDLKNVDAPLVAQKVIQGIYDGVTTKELDKLCMEQAYSMSIQHPEYDKLASRIAISTLHKETPSTFTEVIKQLRNSVDPNGKKQPVIADDIYKIVKKHGHIIDNEIVYDRDYNFDYFGYKTLERSYLLKVNTWEDGTLVRYIVERPQHMWMRVAIGIHKNDIDAAIETYHMLSNFKATHATPTLFNAGTVKNQLSSCYLIAMSSDSINGIYDTQKECALISQHAGGIGLHIHNIRSKGSPIYGTGGVSNGIVPMLKVFHETARYVDQCFSSETLVETENGTKCISSLEPQKDKVKTSDGKYNTVINKKKFNGKYNILDIETQHGDKVSVTDKHIFLCVRNAVQFDDILLKEKLSRGLLELEWIESGELTKNDVIISVSSS